MTFICKIVRSCLNGDGVRDYMFRKPVDENLYKHIQEDSQCFEIKKIGSKDYMRYVHPHYKVFGFKNDKKIRVEYIKFHPEETRENLENKLNIWADQS